MAYIDLIQAKNGFLTQAQSLLLANNFSTATNTDLIIAGALFKAFGTVNSFSPIAIGALDFITSEAAIENLNVFLADANNYYNFELLLIDANTMIAIVNNTNALNAILSSGVAMTMLCASSTAMSAIVASSTAMSAVAASSTAMSAVAASSTAIHAVAASSTAMSAVAASSTAMSAVAASSTAMSAVAANSTAMTAVYSSPLIVKYTTTSDGWTINPYVIRNGIGLLVRVTTLDNAAAWTPGSVTGENINIDGSLYACPIANAGVFIQTTIAPKRFASVLSIYTYNKIEIAYIPLSA